MKKTVLILVLLWLSGCSTKQAPLKVYTLHISADIKTVPSSKFRYKSIKVAYPQSLKEKMSQKMRYSYSSAEQGNYQNSQWSNNIGKLLQGTFIEVLDRSRLFKSVLPYTSTVQEDYRLESTIFAFSHHVRGEESHAIVSVQFLLISTDSGKLVKSKRFSYKVPTKTKDANGYVEATNEAVGRLSGDLVRWLY